MPEATSTAFDPEFISIPVRWVGRIVSSESWQDNIIPENFDNESEIKGWGYRYKVRIFAWHTGEKEVVPDEHLTIANVIYPITAGSGHGGYSETPSLAAGSIVTGFFLDGSGGQEPYIDGILGNSLNDVPKIQQRFGFDQFNDTYGPDAKVGDHSRIDGGSTVNNRNDNVHQRTKSDTDQHLDAKTETPLDAPRTCEERNAEMKGIQLTMKNMVNDIERIKKDISKAQGVVGDIQSFAGTIIPYIDNAAFQASKYVKTLLGNARGWVLREVRKKINEVAPFLFPTEISKLENKLRKSLGSLSCAFSKIINGLQKTFQGLLNDITNKFINIPMCAAEDIVTKLINGVLDQIVSGITEALDPIISFIKSATGKGLNFLDSAFNLLDIISGIAKFFQCDEKQDCPEYDQINQAGEATPGDGLQIGIPKLTLGEPPLSDTPGPPCPTNPQRCGPSEVKIFGQDGFGAIANAIISPNSNALIGFDIRNPGANYFNPPYVSITDGCGRGRGASARANVNSDGTIRNIAVTSSGTGYIPRPDGSTGGNGVTWKEPDEGFIVDDDGNYFVVPASLNPEILPDPTPRPEYSVILEIDDIEILDPGFGYEPGDTIRITPDNGAILEPVFEGDKVSKVNVIKSGLGFDDFPVIEVVSDTGYNAELIPIFRPVDPETVEQIPETAAVIQVIDCVGKV